MQDQDNNNITITDLPAEILVLILKILSENYLNFSSSLVNFAQTNKRINAIYKDFLGYYFRSLSLPKLIEDYLFQEGIVTSFRHNFFEEVSLETIIEWVVRQIRTFPDDLFEREPSILPFFLQCSFYLLLLKKEIFLEKTQYIESNKFQKSKLHAKDKKIIIIEVNTLGSEIKTLMTIIKGVVDFIEKPVKNSPYEIFKNSTTFAYMQKLSKINWLSNEWEADAAKISTTEVGEQYSLERYTEKSTLTLSILKSLLIAYDLVKFSLIEKPLSWHSAAEAIVARAIGHHNESVQIGKNLFNSQKLIFLNVKLVVYRTQKDGLSGLLFAMYFRNLTEEVLLNFSMREHNKISMDYFHCLYNKRINDDTLKSLIEKESQINHNHSFPAVYAALMHGKEIFSHWLAADLELLIKEDIHLPRNDCQEILPYFPAMSKKIFDQFNQGKANNKSVKQKHLPLSLFVEIAKAFKGLALCDKKAFKKNLAVIIKQDEMKIGAFFRDLIKKEKLKDYLENPTQFHYPSQEANLTTPPRMNAHVLALTDFFASSGSERKRKAPESGKLENGEIEPRKEGGSVKKPKN